MKAACGIGLVALNHSIQNHPAAQDYTSDMVDEKVVVREKKSTQGEENSKERAQPWIQRDHEVVAGSAGLAW